MLDAREVFLLLSGALESPKTPTGQDCRRLKGRTVWGFGSNSLGVRLERLLCILRMRPNNLEPGGQGNLFVIGFGPLGLEELGLGSILFARSAIISH